MSDVGRWDTFEIALDADGTYANPFRDVSLTATFTSSMSGQSVDVDGFFDGGPIWRIRFMPVELGEWTWVTKSSDPGLDGKSGSFTCVPPTRPYLRGPLGPKGHHFVHADGTPRYLMSTRLSCQFASPSVWPRVIRLLEASRINRVLFIMGGISGTIKDLYGPGPDFWRYNLVKFQQIDAFIDALRRADILASPYFYYFNDGVQRGLTFEQDQAYIRYGMARFGAYCNVMPVLSNEVEKKYTDLIIQYNLASHWWADDIGAYLKGRSRYGVPVAVHNPMETDNATHPSFYTLMKDWPFKWPDYMLRQIQVSALSTAPELSDDLPEQKTPRYNARGYSRHNEILADLRRFGIPVVNEEPGYEMRCLMPDQKTYYPRPWNSQTPDTLIPTLWTAVTAGAYSMWGSPSTYEMDDPYPKMSASPTPGYLRVLHDCVSVLPYWDLEPANDLVSPGEVIFDGKPFRTNFCLAKPGEAYLVFSLAGCQLSADLAPEGVYDVTQLDPRTGAQAKLARVDGGPRCVSVTGKEQVVLFRRTES